MSRVIVSGVDRVQVLTPKAPELEEYQGPGCKSFGLGGLDIRMAEHHLILNLPSEPRKETENGALGFRGRG